MSTSTTTINENSRKLVELLPSLSVIELERLVKYHNEAYWQRNTPEIDDVTFDKTVETLRAKNPKSPVLDEIGSDSQKNTGNTTGNTASAAAPERRFGTVKHEVPMLSLDKCYDDDTLKKWCRTFQGGMIAVPKIDGVACSIRYALDGHILVAATRGDGKEGDDITENAKKIKDIPHKLNAKLLQEKNALKKDTPFIEVRGEVYLGLARFQSLYAEEFANPRNLAAGALKQKDVTKSAGYGLSFFAYDVLGTQIASEREKRALLAELGFSCPPIEYSESIDDAPALFRKLSELRNSFDYETDGVVYRADSTAEYDRLGVTSHHPKGSIAYKFQGESAITKLLRIDWSVGRSGVVTPVAEVEPINVSGVTVNRASLHNSGYLAKLGLAKECRVELVRRGGVIPHVERVVEGGVDAGGEAMLVATTCPCCGSEIRSDGDFIYCTKPATCPDAIVARVEYFCKVIDVLGFGRKHITSLVNSKLVTRPADLFTITVEQLTTLERMGKVSAKKLVAELDSKRELPLTTFLVSLGIHDVGNSVSAALSEKYGTLEAIQTTTADDVSKLHGVGTRIAQSLLDGLKNNKDDIDALLAQVKIQKPVVVEIGSHPLAGKSVVFTGALQSSDRKTAQKKVAAVGGKTPSGVSADLDYLVVGPEDDGKKSSKQVAAEKHIAKGAKLRMITEAEFLVLLQNDAAT